MINQVSEFYLKSRYKSFMGSQATPMETQANAFQKLKKKVPSR